jgi:CheY-like chemotaxis protein
VIYAGDGEEGLDAARENIPDLILFDMMLPKMSGVDVLRVLKGDVLVKHIPVIVLSGLGQANEAKLLKEGAAAFLMKSGESFEKEFTGPDSGIAKSANRSQSLESKRIARGPGGLTVLTNRSKVTDVALRTGHRADADQTVRWLRAAFGGGLIGIRPTTQF